MGALAAVLALSAVATASASAALPEFSPGAGLTLTGTGGASYFEVQGLAPVPNCSSLAAKAKLTSGKSGTLEVEMKGCHAGFAACQTGPASEVVDFTGTIEPVYLSKEPKNVGLLVKLNEFTAKCGTVTVVVRGSFLGTITPINTGVAAGGRYTLTMKEHEGLNEYTSYETASGEHKSTSLTESIGGGPFLTAGFSSTDPLNTNINSEIKA